MPNPPKFRNGSAIGLLMAAGAAMGLSAPAATGQTTDRGKQAWERQAQPLPALNAQTTARWAGAVSGSWFDPSLWDLGVVPDNTETETFDAVIDARGAAYEVDIEAADLRLDSLRIDSTDATARVGADAVLTTDAIELAAGTLTLAGGEVRGATIDMAPGGMFRVSGSDMSTLQNATIRGGGLAIDASAQVMVSGSLTLDGASVVLNKDSRMEFTGSSTLRGGVIFASGENWRIDLSDGADVRMESNASFNKTGRVHFEDNSQLTISGALDISAPNTFISLTASSTETAGVIRNEGSVQIGSGDMERTSRVGSSAKLVNTGTLQIKNGGWATFSQWENSGLLEADRGGVLRLGGAWGNAGDIIVKSGGNIEFFGTSLTTKELGSLQREEQSLISFISSVIDNRGDVLALDFGGGMILFDGEIFGGVIQASDNQNMEINGRVHDVEVSGGLRLSNFNELRIANTRFRDGGVHLDTFTDVFFEGGNEFTDGARIISEGGRIHINQSSINGVTIVMRAGIGTGGAKALSWLDGKNSMFAGTGEGVLGPDVLVQAEFGGIRPGQFERLINRGRIEVMPDGWLLIDYERFGISPAFINEGVVANPAGGILNIDWPAVQNDGIIYTEGVLNIDSSSSDIGSLVGIQQRGSGVVNLLERWTNTMSDPFIFDSITGSMRLGDGSNFSLNNSLTGGELVFRDGQRLIGAGGVLDGVTIRAGGDFVMDRAGETFGLMPGSVTLPDGDLVLAGDASKLVLLGEHRVDDFDIVSDAALGGVMRTLEVFQDASLTVGDASLRGGRLAVRLADASSSMRNEGLIASTQAGEQIRIAGAQSVFTNAGIMRSVGGASIAIETGEFINEAGALIEGGSFSLTSQAWENRGEIRVGAGGTLTLAGQGVNTGVIAMDGPGQLNMRGDFTTAFLNSIERAGSDVAVGGVWNNAGESFSLADEGAWRLDDGAVRGGSIDLAGKSVGVGGAVFLDDAAIADGRLVVDGRLASLTLDDQTTLTHASVLLTGDGARFAMDRGGTEVTFEVASRGDGAGLVRRIDLRSEGVIGETGAVRGGNAVVMSSGDIVNRGALSADIAGQQLTVSQGAFSSFTNEGLGEAVGGGKLLLLSQTLTNFSNGALTGGRWRVAEAGSTLDLDTGPITTNAADVTLAGAGARFEGIDALTRNLGRFALEAGFGFETVSDFDNEGLLEVGDGSFIAVAGAFTQAGEATLAVTLGADAAARDDGAVRASGEATLGGTLQLSLAPGATIGDRFTVLSAAAILSGFDEVVSTGLGAGRFFELEQTAGRIEAVLVPTPSTLAIFGLGLAAMRRRR